MIISRLYYEGIDFISQIYRNRNLIAELTRRDFSARYIKDILGLTWAIIDPLAFIVILYFVFGTRFGGMSEMQGVPYIVYLITGYIAYNFFSDSLGHVSDSILAYSFMLRKGNFRVAILPVVKLGTDMLMHGIILVIALILLLFNHITPSWYWFQLFYYIFAMLALLTGLAWITSSVSLFFLCITDLLEYERVAGELCEYSQAESGILYHKRLQGKPFIPDRILEQSAVDIILLGADSYCYRCRHHYFQEAPASFCRRYLKPAELPYG
jgi:membrane protein implicated in regulation of membrane protease activity